MYHCNIFILPGFGDGSVKLFDIRTPDTGVATFSDMNSPILDCRLQVFIFILLNIYFDSYVMVFKHIVWMNKEITLHFALFL